MNDLLDIDELIHLAITASSDSRYDQAIIYLKQALDRDNNNAVISYLLSAQYAQIGMYDRAIELSEKAIAINSELDIARFQLGLMYLSLNQPDKAKITWKALHKNNKEKILKLFVIGLEALIHDDLEQCITNLEQGIRLNHSNPALNNNMQNIIDKIKDSNVEGELTVQQVKQSDKETETVIEVEEKSEKGNPNPLFLSAYQKDIQ